MCISPDLVIYLPFFQIAENIGLGDPDHFDDMDKIREAAQLGGAEEFINRLPEGFQTYLTPPVRDHYGELPRGTKTLFGKPVDHGRLHGMGKMNATPISLSGGQMQRLAVYVPFARRRTSL
jgi:hypothetical protein